ncbi:Carnitine O-acetyltransferase [Hypsibius exemplaris]|uniref:Carnitine O-acetyltransferase n=1 Tax=Hypsibius exemplaris TaxID=2072580 RepID=A0A1W0WLN3_HYPEX|nr:Carnitine O-acetyltransferase [Hypsibius exemplaris]
MMRSCQKLSELLIGSLSTLPRHTLGFSVGQRCLQNRAFTEPKKNVDPKQQQQREPHQSLRPNPYHYPLPSLPVPPLGQTLAKYFDSLKPFLSDGELKHTKKLLEEFEKPGGEGEKLQGLLEQRAKLHENWLEEWWLQKGYLEYRSPLPVNVSPGIVFPHQSYTNIEGQLRTAAAFVTHIMEFRELINSGQLEPDSMKGKPLCMSQYLKIFGSYRVPGNTHDEIIVGGEKEDPPFIVVMHRNVLFQVPVQHESGEALSQHELFQQLLSVVTQATAHPTVPVGILTSQDRTTWARTHKALAMKCKMNRHHLELVQKSLFVLCLDSPNEALNSGKKKSQLTNSSRQVMHGDGSNANSGNRWFDKTLQLIVGADGVCGWNYEHTLIEGPPLFRMMEYIVKQTGAGSGHQNSHTSASGNNIAKHATEVRAKHMPFELDTPLVELIDSAKDQMDMLVKDVDLEVMDFDSYGKDFIKSRKLSPDSYFQMAIQLAFYRLYNQVPPTYESASARQFLRGRTETIRSASEESANFVEALVAKAGAATVKKLLTEAVKAHKAYGADASNGNGIDRHLLGLKLTAVEHGMNIPAFLMDVGYTTSTHWKLSTSQGNSDLMAFMCYGPAVADGYGCCYNPMKDRIIAGISSTRSYAATNSRRFAETVADSLMDMRKIVE